MTSPRDLFQLRADLSRVVRFRVAFFAALAFRFLFLVLALMLLGWDEWAFAMGVLFAFCCARMRKSLGDQRGGQVVVAMDMC